MARSSESRICKDHVNACPRSEDNSMSSAILETIRKCSTRLLSYGIGGSAFCVALILNNWWIFLVITLLTYFKDETVLTFNYITVVIVVLVSFDEPWPEKKVSIRHYKAEYVEVMKMSLRMRLMKKFPDKESMKKFLDKEVIH